jgi:hypothetical protein
MGGDTIVLVAQVWGTEEVRTLLKVHRKMAVRVCRVVPT